MRWLRGKELFIVFVCAVGLTLFVFRQYFFDHKILFPSNLLVSSSSPWKYEPIPEYPNGPPNKPIGFDNIRQFFPNRVMLKNAISSGIVPLWNPYIYSGAPFMAAFDTAVWYPFSLVASLLPAVDGWNFLVIIQPIASIVFMYLFLKSMKFRPAIAAYGAFAYALCGWMVVYWQESLVLEHSYLWLPLALYASNLLWERKAEALGFLLLVMALTFSVFGGFLQMSIYVYAVVIVWNMLRLTTSDRNSRTGRPAILVVLALVCSILVACIQLIPSVQSFLLSPRGTGDGSFVFRDDLLSWKYLITLFAPDYWGNPGTYNYFGGNGFYFEKMIFIGVIPLLFAVYGMIIAKQKTLLFWTIFGLLCFSMGFALPTSWFPYYLHIPVLSSSYPTRIFAVSAFSFIILSCYGVEVFLRDTDRKKMVYILAAFSVVLAVGWSVVISAWCIHRGAFQCIGLTPVAWARIGMILGIANAAGFYATVSLRNMIVPTLFIVSGWVLVVLSRWSKKLVFVLVWVLMMSSGLYFAQKYVYFGEWRFVYPDLPVTKELSNIAGYDRIWGYGNAFIEKNLPQYFRWFSTDGYGNLSSNRYAQLLSTIVNGGKLGGPIRRSDTDLYEVSERDPLGSANPYRLRMMSLFGVKYILEAKKGELKDKIPTEARFPHPQFTLVWEDPVWRIWKYTDVLPRAVFATAYLVRRDPQQLVDTVYDPSVNLANTVVLEQDPAVPSQSAGGTSVSTGSAVITSYGLNTVTISTSSPSDGFAVLSDTYYPGWTAEVDGKTAEIYRADFTIRAVPVPKGTHTVIFMYKPVTFNIGVLLTLMGILLTVGVSYSIAKKTE
jgi:hypothetical protein